jgi:hypothetical protein
VIDPKPAIAGMSPVPEPPAKPWLTSKIFAPSPTEGGPVPDPPNKARPLFRFNAETPTATSLAALPQGMFSAKALGPQPIPPGVSGELLSLPPEMAEFETKLSYPYPAQELRELLQDNWKLVGMLLCQLHEKIWRLRCDEVAVVTTDNQGRFETRLYYPCLGDQPDYYFWVEYEFEAGFETVYHPSMACTTKWDYPCGSEVILPISDPRIPGCTAFPDLPGCQVVVLSIGNDVAIRQIQTSAAGTDREGLTTDGKPFGGILEPRVDFSRTALREKGVRFYRWSYRRLSGPDGASLVAPDASVPVSDFWTPIDGDVYRHWKSGTSYPSYLVGPLPVDGDGRTGPEENLFEIHPAYYPGYPDAPPAEDASWVALNPHIDLADAYFETVSLAGSPESGPTETGPAPDDLAAGRYELKLELFDEAGELVDWQDKEIDLRIMEADAPFGTDDYNTVAAPPYNRYTKEGMTGLWGFQMVVRVDNNHCYAEVLPVGGDVEPDPDCGFHIYDPGDDVGLRFIARHPNHFASFSFNTNRATGPNLPIAQTSGITGESATNGYAQVGDFGYEKSIVESTLRGDCANAAFGEHLDVRTMAQNGYTRLRYLDMEDTAAFALAEPCERGGGRH